MTSFAKMHVVELTGWSREGGCGRVYGLSDTPFEDGDLGIVSTVVFSVVKHHLGVSVRHFFLILTYITVSGCFQLWYRFLVVEKEMKRRNTHLNRIASKNRRMSSVSRCRSHYAKEFASRNIDGVYAGPSLLRNAGLDRCWESRINETAVLRCHVLFYRQLALKASYFL